MKERYKERQAKIKYEQQVVQQILAQQILSAMNGDTSLIQNGSIPNGNLPRVDMLQGDKMTFSRRGSQMQSIEQKDPMIKMNQTPDKTTPSNSTQASTAQPSQSSGAQYNQTVQQFHQRNKSVTLDISKDHQMPMEQLNHFKDHVLPQIQTVRNSGFAGMALHSVKKAKSPYPGRSSTNLKGGFGPPPSMFGNKRTKTIERRKFIPVNHYITNNEFNMTVNNSFPQQPQQTSFF